MAWGTRLGLGACHGLRLVVGRAPGGEVAMGLGLPVSGLHGCWGSDEGLWGKDWAISPVVAFCTCGPRVPRSPFGLASSPSRHLGLFAPPGFEAGGGIPAWWFHGAFLCAWGSARLLVEGLR